MFTVVSERQLSCVESCTEEEKETPRKKNKSSHIVFGKYTIHFSIFLTVVFAQEEGRFSAV